MIIYVVMCLKKSLEVSGVETKISKEKGFEGYLPVFRTFKYAEKFAGKTYQIVPMAIREELGE